MDKYILAERTLPDGRQVYVSPLMAGTARISVCNADDPMFVDANY